VVVPLVCSRVSEEGAAATISVNELGLTSICFKSVAHNTSCINWVHHFKNVKRKHYKCKAKKKLIKVVICVISSYRLEVNENLAL
jgi:hypothetical protein